MKQLVVVAFAFSAVAGCKKTEAPAASGSGSATVGSGSGSSSGAPATDDRDEMIQKMTEFTDRVCACADAACAAKVNDELTKWTVAFANKTMESKAVPTADQMKQIEALQGRFVGCIQKLTPVEAAAGSGSAKSQDSPACQRFANAATGELNCLALDDKQMEEMRAIVHTVLATPTDAACDDGYAKVKAQAKASGCPAPD
ncbi:MAG TPA: hypothetical protein VGM90_08095 [Kofleriaceae bacterium]|jgi:hypothetical protein